MRTLVRRALLGLLGVAALLLMFGPTERVGPLPDAVVPERETPEATVAAVLGAEALIPDIREGAAKEVIWATPERVRTPLSVIYVHGFSAGKAEMRPMPDRVAAELGANLYYARLSGHGRSGAAMAGARATHWMLDMAEALAIGRAIGDRVLVIASGLGGALAALSAVEPSGADRVAGHVLISPNFGIAAPGSRLLTLPFARWLVPLALGPTRSVEPASEAQAAAWTMTYPSEALVPMAAVAQAAQLTDYAFARTPALFAISDEDRAIDPALAREAAERWGGGAEVLALTPGPGDDPQAHVLAGDILSPGLTERMTDAILDWARRRGIAPEG